jgi:hypothetical protein
MSNKRDLHDDHISRLYQMGEQPEPPEHLDREIKSAARDGIPNKKPKYIWPSLATAAVLVLSISMVLKVLQQEPIEKDVLNPPVTNGDVITPNVTLQEEEMAVDQMEETETIQRRYRSTQQKEVPVLVKPQGADAVKLEAAPSIAFELKAKKAAPKKCNGIVLPETDSKDEWIKLYQKLLELGQPEAARCLQQAYGTRFGQPISITIEK